MKINEEFYIVPKSTEYEDLLAQTIKTMGMRGSDNVYGDYIFVDFGTSTVSQTDTFHLTLRWMTPETTEDYDTLRNTPNEYNPNLSNLRQKLLNDCGAVATKESFYEGLKPNIQPPPVETKPKKKKQPNNCCTRA